METPTLVQYYHENLFYFLVSSFKQIPAVSQIMEQEKNFTGNLPRFDKVLFSHVATHKICEHLEEHETNIIQRVNFTWKKQQLTWLYS